MSTQIVDIDQLDGSRKIREYLGIDTSDFELLDRYNLLVEGDTDKYYLEELAKFFGLRLPNIISANGASNVPQYLKFYKAFYADAQDIKPCVQVLLDNDPAGRDVFLKVKPETFDTLDVRIQLVPNFLVIVHRG